MSKPRTISGAKGYQVRHGADLRRHSSASVYDSSGIAFLSHSHSNRGSKGSFSFLHKFNFRKALAKMLGRKLKTKDRPNIHEISVALLREWQHSFSSLLQHPDGLELFEDFLVSEFSEENIHFWKACEHYRTVPDHMLEKEAAIIYEEYIAPQAPKQVNIDYQVKKDITENMKSPDRSCFTHGQHSIYMLMRMDGFARFTKSEGFQTALGRGRNRSKSM